MHRFLARRDARLLFLLPLLLAPAARAPAQPAADPPTITVQSVGMTVSDLDRAVAFYRDVLQFEPRGERRAAGADYAKLVDLPGAGARIARLALGDEVLELTAFREPRGREFPGDSRSNDRWFQHVAIIVRDMDAAYARLVEHGVRPASIDGPQRLPDWNRSAGGIRAFYFRDPDGHFLEILWFPPDKGDPKWQRPTDRLFLGIDHTAIVVADTEASLRFYRDRLGLAVAGASENYGPEQERLNNVRGARLRITTLRGGSGPGIELLEYLAPRDGRPYPSDARVNDLLHWHVRLVGGGDSPRPKPAADEPNGLGVLVRDPDGHVVHLAAP